MHLVLNHIFLNQITLKKNWEFAKQKLRTPQVEQTEDTNDSDTAISTTSARDSEECCLCGHCTVMPLGLENDCCHEVFAERHELTELELAFAQFLRYKSQNEAAANDMNNRFVCM